MWSATYILPRIKANDQSDENAKEVIEIKVEILVVFLFMAMLKISYKCIASNLNIYYLRIYWGNIFVLFY